MIMINLIYPLFFFTCDDEKEEEIDENEREIIDIDSDSADELDNEWENDEINE